MSPSSSSSSSSSLTPPREASALAAADAAPTMFISALALDAVSYSSDAAIASRSLSPTTLAASSKNRRNAVIVSRVASRRTYLRTPSACVCASASLARDASSASLALSSASFASLPPTRRKCARAASQSLRARSNFSFAVATAARSSSTNLRILPTRALVHAASERVPQRADLPERVRDGREQLRADRRGHGPGHLLVRGRGRRDRADALERVRERGVRARRPAKRAHPADAVAAVRAVPVADRESFHARLERAREHAAEADALARVADPPSAARRRERFRVRPRRAQERAELADEPSVLRVVPRARALERGGVALERRGFHGDRARRGADVGGGARLRLNLSRIRRVVSASAGRTEKNRLTPPPRHRIV